VPPGEDDAICGASCGALDASCRPCLGSDHIVFLAAGPRSDSAGQCVQMVRDYIAEPVKVFTRTPASRSLTRLRISNEMLDAS